MGRKLRIILAAICLLIFAAFICLFLFVRDIDPVYQGKHLSLWAQEIVPWQGPTTPQAMSLRKYGSNAAPMITMMLNARDSDLKKKVLDLLHKQKVIKISAQYQPASVIQQGGLKAAIVLGSEVRATAPAIAKLLSDYPATIKDPTIADCAVHVLAAMGTDGIPGLLQALTNQNPGVSVKAAELLSRAPSTATPEVIAALEKCAASTNPGMQAVSRDSLALIKERLDQHIPASATKWTDSNTQPAAQPSVWNTLNGTRILSSSPLVSGFRTEDMFGTRLGGQMAEKGTVIFQDNMPDGTVNTVEWETPAPVSVSSFGLVGFHQPADQYFERSFRDFRLYAWDDNSSKYVQIYSEKVGVPYGNGYFSSLLFLFRNLESPVTARKFKAEFIQNSSGPYFGSRVVALYGFTNKLDLPTALKALENQDATFQAEARRFFTEQAHAPK